MRKTVVSNLGYQDFSNSLPGRKRVIHVSTGHETKWPEMKTVEINEYVTKSNSRTHRRKRMLVGGKR